MQRGGRRVWRRGEEGMEVGGKEGRREWSAWGGRKGEGER